MVATAHWAEWLQAIAYLCIGAAHLITIYK